MKYKLDKNDTINIDGKTLYRIVALREVSHIKKGERGGYIEKEENLSQDNECWVHGNACVFDNAKVYDNVKIYDNAKIYGNAQVYGNARVFGSTKVHGNTRVFQSAIVFGDKEIFGYAWVQ